jgi:acetyl-CoA acetyltransferase
MRDVYLIGAGMTRFAKQPGATLKSLTAEAVTTALKDAGCGPGDLDACYFGNAVAASITGQEMLPGQFTLRPLGIGEIPVFNVENACAAASTALHLAWQAVATGLADVALAVGTEKMTHADKARSFAAIGGSVDVDEIPAELPPDRSFLMDMYARTAARYLADTGATREDLARVVVKNQRNGRLNPMAQYGGELTVDQVLGMREIVWPFTLPMCSPVSDGSAAAVLASGDRVRGAGPRIRILASVIRTAPADGPAGGSGGSSPRASTAGGSGGSSPRANAAGQSPPRVTALAAAAAYEQAGLGPGDLDLAEVHDAAASAELVIYEQIGLARPGEGAAAIRSGRTELGGRIPVNTSGGLLARGHPIGATGLAQVAEAVQQLRGEAGPRQVAGARVALTHNAGGWHGDDNVVSAVHVFAREGERTS